jgi:Tol biopolymer transport system component
VAVDAITGKQSPIFESNDLYLSKLAWLPDGDDLLALNSGRDSRHQIVEISFRDRRSRAVTHDVNNYSDLSLSADGHMLATVLSQGRYDLFVAPASDLGSGQAEQLTSGSDVQSFTWTPDGQVILEQAGGTLNLFDPKTGSKSPLTSTEQDGFAFEPSACANGRYVVFSMAGHRGAKAATIWRMDAGGGNLKQLSDGKADQSAICSPDGRWVFYWNYFDGGKLTRVPLDGGKAERISELPAYGFDISPDGKLAAFATVPSPGGPRKQLALVPIDSPQSTKFLELQRQDPNETIRFTRDGKGVVYPFRVQDADNLWLQPLDGSPGKQITNFKSEHIADFHWTFDGSTLGTVRGHTDSDVVLLQESKP